MSIRPPSVCFAFRSGKRRVALKQIKEIGLVVAITLLLLLAEGGVRLFAPQHVDTSMLEGGSLAVEDSLLGHRNRPGAVARQHGPEFTEAYPAKTATSSSPVRDRVMVLLSLWEQEKGGRSCVHRKNRPSCNAQSTLRRAPACHPSWLFIGPHNLRGILAREQESCKFRVILLVFPVSI